MTRCTHVWPDELTPDTTCLSRCGLVYGEWTEEDEMNIDEGLRRENRRREDLVRKRREGLASSDPAERAKWLNRDAYLGRLP